MVKTHLVPYIWDTEYLVCCYFYILQSLRGGKWIDLYQIDNYNITELDKQISKKFSSNIRTENTVSMKCRFEKFVIKFLC